MRLLTLDLLRYGHLTDVRLDFPEHAALHVVLGANEAGKSTALSAIGDALYGFPHNSAHAFLHETGKLRLGITVMGRDGTRASFLRRKGRQNTLMAPDETPLPEAALERFLGGVGRERFRDTFGLDGAGLREHGRALAEGGGGAGEGLLAGMGVPRLQQALARLDRQADELHGTRHRSRRLPAAADAFAAAQRALDAATIRPAEWQEAREAVRRAEADLAGIIAEEATLKREELRLRRARAVAPLLRRLAEEVAELAPLAEAPALPADAAETLARLTAALRKAAEDEAREDAAARRLADQLAALPRDAAVLARQDAIDALAMARATALGAQGDLPGVRQAAAEQAQRMAAAAERLGLDLPPGRAREALPRAAEREAAQRLLRSRTTLLARLEGATTALRGAERRHEQARQALLASPPPAPAAALRRAIDAVRAEGPMDREVARLAREAAEAERRAAAALAALDLWTGDAAALAACRLPLPATAEEAARAMAAATQAAEEAGRALESAAAEMAALEEALARIARGETVPTPAAIAESRARRDAAWRLIRRQLEGGAAPAPGEWTTLPAGAPAEVFEALRDAADRLADARADDAGRVTEYATQQARLALLRDRHPALSAAAAAAWEGAAAAAQAWQDLWAPAGITPASPPAMLQWREARAKVLDLMERAAALRQQREEAAARRDAARAALLPLLPTPPAAPELAPLLAEATEACAAAEAAEAAHRERAEALRLAAERLEEARAARDQAASALADSDGAWQPALLALGLPATAGVEAVEAALAAWGAVAEAATAWQSNATRIEAMEASVASFGRETLALAAALGEAVGDGQAFPLSAQLTRRLAAARQAEASAEGLQVQIRERTAAAEAARAAARRAEAALGGLHALAGTDGLPALEEAVRQAARRGALAESVAALRASLHVQGEGLPEAQLREEVEGFDPDQAALRLEAIERRQAELGHRRTELGAEQQAARARLSALEAGRDAAAHAQDMQQHLADAQEAAERYARLHLARRLLKAGIERLRQDQQGPMLRAATHHFALLTAGRYTRLAAEEQDDGRTLLQAVRADGSACPIDQLSEGTRDQLYLALRVAAIEAHAAAAEPLPFIADDLLATFDDGRAASAITLLRQLGQVTQVILFTHHAHLAALAARQPGVAVLELPAVPVPALAARPAA
ncbi:AAA family ATPase [Roseomonas stagni]|uniref:AAA family ATPase n=1 Tax=Falsiroseomonas algicola TaxID=2716930 RepID=A0A6M1LSW1_9PROT|nr:AAA family ATPase [Falsiroseomonas algicola]NGM23575.1 AAA family ATPase [Falsiroseomonas algicola]